MSINIRFDQPVGRFEDVYPHAPFSELIRLALAAAEGVRRWMHRGERRGIEAGRPAMAS